MKIKLLTLLILASAYSGVLGQSSNWKINTSLALVGSDDNIYGGKNVMFGQSNELAFGKIIPSYYFDVGIEYKLLKSYNMGISSGIKYGYEWNNAFRHYNHCAFEGDFCHKILLSVNSYGYHMIASPINIEYNLKLGNKPEVKIGVTISPMFRFLSYYDSRFKYLWGIDYFSTEVLPSISIILDKYEVGVNGRICQHRMVDPIIYDANNQNSRPIHDGNYVNNNSLKIGMFLKYSL